MPEHPESILYQYLTVPLALPRRAGITKAARYSWRPGRAAGYGRAQGGYDEMMFRAMVRDGALSTIRWAGVQGHRGDFQVGANAYLYGTRFMSYLALEYGPEK